jgi:predicted RNA-binding protein with TRAM domain
MINVENAGSMAGKKVRTKITKTNKTYAKGELV